MAQTGYTPISLYYSTTAAATPSAGNLANGELAINITDGKLFYKDNGGNVQVIGTKGGVGSSSNTQVLYNSSGLVVGSANLTFDGTKLSVGNLLNAGLTASKPVFTDANKNLVSTGTLETDQGGTGLTSWTTGDIPYFSAGTSLSKLAIGAGSTVLTSSGSAPQWTSLASLSIGTATNLAGGAAGSLPYQTAPGTTTFLSIGTASQVLRVNSGATALEYVNQSALSVGSATTATTSTNIAGGSAGAIAYNSASGTTTFLGIGSASQVLQVNSGATAPEWVSSTGTGNVVRATSPTLVTPTLGAATATTINKLTITAPASSATLTIADGKTFAANATLTLAGTDGTTMTMPASSTTLAGLGIAQTFTQDQTIAANLTLNAQGDLRFADADSSNYVAFQAPSTVASNILWTLPSADGTSGQALVTNGTGTLSWASVAGIPGGSTTQVQFNDGGVFGGDADFTYNKTTNILTAAGGFSSAGTYNNVTITAPASSATLTIANTKTFTVSNTLTLQGTDSTTMTFPGSSTTLAGLGIAQTFTQDQTIAGNLTLNAQGDLRFADSDSSNWVAFQGPATVASNITWTLPSVDGSTGQALVTNGTGTLSWATPGGSPGGSTTQLQYNNAGSFAGATNLVTDGSNLTINAQGDLRFGDSDSSNWVAFQAPATVASNVTWTLPNADGTSGQVLSTDGSGTLSWTTASGGGGGTFATYTYTGDGTTTTFAGGSGMTVNNVLAILNGVTQEPTTDYTISGTNVVFGTAPANGEEIQIRLMGGGGGGGGSATILENLQTISSNYTITSSYNGISAGPVTVNTGVAVTVGTGQRWLILE